MRNYFPLICILTFLHIPIYCGEDVNYLTKNKITSKEIIENLRKPKLIGYWGLFSGNLVSKNKKRRISKYPIELGIRFAQKHLDIKVTFNKTEVFIVRQKFVVGIQNVKITRKTNNNSISLADVGIKASDFTMSFLYWDFKKELPTKTYRGYDCRLLELEHPKTKEKVIIWIPTEISFPIKVQWFKENSDYLYKKLIFTAFKKIKNFYFIREFILKNNSLKTKVRFKHFSLNKLSEQEMPPDLLDIK